MELASYINNGYEESIGFLTTSSILFLLAQLFGIVVLVLEFKSYQIKEKSKYFLTTGTASIFWTAMFFCMGLAMGMAAQTALIVAAAYSAMRNLVFWRVFAVDTPKAKKFGIRFLLVMVVIACAAGIMAIINAADAAPDYMRTQVLIIQILGMVSALSFVVGQYLPGVHAVRITIIFYAAVVLLTQTPLNIIPGDGLTVDIFGMSIEDFRWNIMGIMIEAAKIISVIVFYLRFGTKASEDNTPLKFAKREKEKNGRKSE